jgi:hypothetical protein
VSAAGVRSTTVVHGRLAMKRERLGAARRGGIGGQVMAIEHVASRLAGGFNKLVESSVLRETVAACLETCDLGELEPIKDLPGLPSAAAATLMKVWLADIDLSSRTEPRLESIRSLEAAVRATLPAGTLSPRDLVAVARSRMAHAPAVLGPVTVKGMTELHPLWRALLLDLAAHVPVKWEAGPRPVPSWLTDAVAVSTRLPTKPAVTALSCATARHEAIEAVRWMRSLMADGIPASEIAVATTSPDDYDDHFVSLARDSDLPIHFDRGYPALATQDGQRAAALADVLIRGLTQKRVRRVLSAATSDCASLAGLPADWSEHLPPDASLTTAERWEGALTRREQAIPTSEVLLPIVRLLALGPESAVEAGETLLSGLSLSLWKRALADGPATALDQTIKSLRVTDQADPFSCAAYMSAESLAANPRKHVRLVGLSSRSWPRAVSEDALIPSHVVPPRDLDALPAGEADRRDYATILATTEGSVTLCWPRRDAEGRVLGISPLVPDDMRSKADRLQRARTPEHALSNSDRLFARPDEFAGLPLAVAALACWTDWREVTVTAHDGLVRAAHPRLTNAMAQHQSATSLRTMLRDPLGFTWRYALGFRAPEFDDEPLALDARQFGNLVHSVLRRTVDALESGGGMAGKSEARIRATVNDAVIDAGGSMETTQPVPPPLIWRRTLDMAEAMAIAALLHDLPALDGQRSYTEVAFGGGDERITSAPWDTSEIVRVPGTPIKIRGFIDRLDLSADEKAARVLDYKSGKAPKNASEIVLKGGAELQRCIYGFAVKSLLGGDVQVESALLYPRNRIYAPLAEPDTTLSDLAGFVAEAVRGLEAGLCLPGADAEDTYNDLSFALPANARATYLRRKRDAVNDMFGPVADVWEAV